MTTPISETSTSGLCHVCQAGTAAALVRTLVDEPVIEIIDDAAIGPLHDIDAIRPRARIAFWTEVLCASGAFPHFDVGASLVVARQALEQLSRHRGTCIIWAGSHLTEQLMRRRLHWWLRETSATVAEIRVPDNDRHLEAGTSICLHDVATLRAASEQLVVVDKRERYCLAQEWVALRAQGSTVRVWEDQRIAARPYGFLDRRLLALAGDEPKLLPRLVGQAMGTIGYGEACWRWRVRQLVALGQMKVVEGCLDAWQTAVIHCELL